MPEASNQNEYWDLYDRYGNPMDMVIQKPPDGMASKDIFPANAYHICIDCVIADKGGNILLTKRADCKHNGLTWECTQGSAIEGESARDAAQREVKEETGLEIPLDQFRQLTFFPTDLVLRYIFLVMLDKIDLSQVKLQPGETVDAMTVTIEDYMTQQLPDGCVLYARQYPRIMGYAISAILAAMNRTGGAFDIGTPESGAPKTKTPPATETVNLSNIQW